MEPLLAQVYSGLSQLPRDNSMCYRVCRLSLGEDEKLDKVLSGNPDAFDCYKPGSIVLWRHAASATTDPSLAEELALPGDGSDECCIVFKIRRSLNAHTVKKFAEFPKHGEVLFPPFACFRVVGLFP